MNKENIYHLLSAKMDIDALAKDLRNKYFPIVINRFNSDDSRKRFGLYKNEKIPSNERNLTDVRTRMGVLIEFELARISNELLREYGIEDLFWCYVVANRFPDLEVRENSGVRLLRFEIKCLQCIAEEKSANFDTLIKDIDPNTDFVIVCLWDWFSEQSENYKWDSVPKIIKVYVFHAYSLAKLRDAYWLNTPPSDLGGGYQGFDIRYAVTCKDGVYSKEQGNLGKLMRIWSSDFQYGPKDSAEIIDTKTEYEKFQREVEFEGFKILASKQLNDLFQSAIQTITIRDEVGYESQGVLYIFRPRLDSKGTTPTIKSLCKKYRAKVVVVMSGKYKANVFRYDNGKLDTIERDLKPKKIVHVINRI